MDKEKEETPKKKRSKKHDETKLAINGTFEQVIAASFLGKAADKKAK